MRGFTLVEVVVTLVILSLMAVVSVPAFLATREGSDLDRASEQVAVLLRTARDASVRDAIPVTVVIDSASGTVWLQDGVGVPLGLPAGVRLELTSARARFAFQPAGTVYPDTVFLRGSTGARQITVNPWSGHVLVAR